MYPKMMRANFRQLNYLANTSLQAGIGLPAAIFVITIMAVIAIGINQLISQNAQTFEEEINLIRAFYAAESGAGFAMMGLINVPRQ